jgi:hypothetical protein
VASVALVTSDIDQTAACLAELEHEYVTAVDDDGETRFLRAVPAVRRRSRAGSAG